MVEMILVITPKVEVASMKFSNGIQMMTKKEYHAQKPAGNTIEFRIAEHQLTAINDAQAKILKKYMRTSAEDHQSAESAMPNEGRVLSQLLPSLLWKILTEPSTKQVRKRSMDDGILALEDRFGGKIIRLHAQGSGLKDAVTVSPVAYRSLVRVTKVLGDALISVPMQIIPTIMHQVVHEKARMHKAALVS